MLSQIQPWWHCPHLKDELSEKNRGSQWPKVKVLELGLEHEVFLKPKPTLFSLSHTASTRARKLKPFQQQSALNDS